MTQELSASQWRQCVNDTTLSLGIWASAHTISRSALKDPNGIQKRVHVVRGGWSHRHSLNELPEST